MNPTEVVVQEINTDDAHAKTVRLEFSQLCSLTGRRHIFTAVLEEGGKAEVFLIPVAWEMEEEV